MNSLALAGQVGFVVGAASAHGRAIAVALAEAGMDLALGDCNGMGETFAVHSVANELWAIGRRQLVVTMDRLEPASVSAALRQPTAELGSIDLLVNVFGYAEPLVGDEPGDRASESALARLLRGFRLLCEAAAPAMIERGAGRIVNVATSDAAIEQAGSPPLVTARDGVLELTRALAAEWRGRIAVNCAAATAATAASALRERVLMLASAPLDVTGQIFQA